MRKILVILAVVFCLTAVFAGCAKPVRDDDQFLDIFISNFGYGTDWAEPLLDGFGSQDWVKQKYPDFDYRITPNSVRGQAVDEVMSGATSYDIFFGIQQIKSKIMLNKDGKSSIFAELSDVYDSKVPNEDITVKEKMIPAFYDKVRTLHLDDTEGYYEMPWVSGMQGLIYNKTEFDKLGLSLPRTTDELYSTASTILSEGKTPFIFTTQEVYWAAMMFPMWWAQYEGLENYNLYYQGLVKGADSRLRYSSDIFKQTGRLRSLETIYSLIGVEEGKTENPFNYKYVNTESFTQVQTQFLLGNGLIMPNGDWLGTEMKSLKEEGITSVSGLMKTPVISSIVEKLQDKSMTDELLREVIDAVDGGESSYQGVAQTDFDRIKEARNMTMPATDHYVFVPEYASAKELAKDLLRFMATDEANKIFAAATSGATMPFKYDYEKDSPEIYNEFSYMQKQRLAYSKDSVFLNKDNINKTNYYGGLSALTAPRRILDALFVSQSSKDRQSPQKVYDDEIGYWNEVRWQAMLTAAGL